MGSYFAPNAEAARQLAAKDSDHAVRTIHFHCMASGKLKEILTLIDHPRHGERSNTAALRNDVGRR